MTCDGSNRLTQIVEQPSGDTTTLTYDDAGNLLSETRTGTSAYSGVYTYFKDRQRKTAKTITSGTTTHDGTYTYDTAGRLSQVVDAATSQTEVYSWNANGTLIAMPGPVGSNYRIGLAFNEEKQLARITRRDLSTNARK